MYEHKYSYFYIVVTVQSTVTGKRYAYVDRVSDCDEICRRYATAETDTRRYAFGHICPTRKRAVEIAEQWNADFKRSGRYPEGREWF